MIAEALRERVVSVGGWATFEDHPAVFLDIEPPVDCAAPLVVIESLGGPSWGARASKGAVHAFDIFIHGDRGKSSKTLRALADAVWDALERETLFADGWIVAGMNALRPIYDVDLDGFPRYRITAEVIARSE